MTHDYDIVELRVAVPAQSGASVFEMTITAPDGTTSMWGDIDSTRKRKVLAAIVSLLHHLLK